MSLKRQRTHQPTPFQLKKKFGGGKSQKKAKGWLVGRVRACPHSRRGSELAALAEMGSDFGVKSHQIGTNSETVALSGGFFAGSAQRRPAVFLGGVKKLVVIYDDFFLSHL